VPEQMQVGIVQGNVPSREKLTGAGILRSRQVYWQGYQHLAEAGVDAVLTPEGAIPDAWDDFLQENNLFYRAVQKRQTVLWLGTFAMVKEASTYTVYQTLLALVPGQTQVNQYHKIKLVPLGEYIPPILTDVVGTLTSLDAAMIPGARQQSFDSGLGRAAVGICYDSAFSWIFREQVGRGGEFIITTANNDPYPLRMMQQHHAQDVMRAIETDRWAVRGTNTGLSGLVDPHGHTVWLSMPNQYVEHIAMLYRRHSQTLYVKFGDILTPTLTILAIAWLGMSRRGVL
jgi:apolipoprotein N-acyltransferase